jgi:hypothetical protein
MNWKLLFARDSQLWQALFYGGAVCVGLSLLPAATIEEFPSWVVESMPTVRFLALIATILGGKMGLSFADKKANLT